MLLGIFPKQLLSTLLSVATVRSVPTAAAVYAPHALHCIAAAQQNHLTEATTSNPQHLVISLTSAGCRVPSAAAAAVLGSPCMLH
jgi:hypothetical protein